MFHGTSHVWLSTGHSLHGGTSLRINQRDLRSSCKCCFFSAEREKAFFTTNSTIFQHFHTWLALVPSNPGCDWPLRCSTDVTELQLPIIACAEGEDSSLVPSLTSESLCQSVGCIFRSLARIKADTDTDFFSFLPPLSVYNLQFPLETKPYLL